MNIRQKAEDLFREHFGHPPQTAAYAPGRVEILGNHTDYNEGYVLSAAIEQGTWFLAAPAPASECQVVAGDIRAKAIFRSSDPQPDPQTPWADYIKGVWAGLPRDEAAVDGFLGLFLGNVPLGAGLSSSAALEMSSAMALASLCGLTIPALDLARIGQTAEHRYAGVQCGLLDQITSLFGQLDCLVHTDFRTLKAAPVPLGDRLRFLIVNTGVKHRLVDSAYNRRRSECRRALEHFAVLWPHRGITALRDLGSADWHAGHDGLEEATARRALHVIGENERVQTGVDCLSRGETAGFGNLMFESHESSRINFENSCPELDFVVETARETEGVSGARLSGGGFGGSAVLLLSPEAAESAARRLEAAYARRFDHDCVTLAVRPAAGAFLEAGT